MCFSSEASLIATATIGTLGVIALKKAQPSWRLVAMVPFLFAVQQLSEGLEWLVFEGQIGREWLTPATYVFLFFAQVLWPAWLPFAVYVSETDSQRRKFLLPIVILGFGLAIYHTYCLFAYNVYAQPGDHHILYRREYEQFENYLTHIVYLLATVIPPFLSSNRRLQVVGILNVISLLVTFFLYRDYLISVWCYFAAVISAGILWAVYPRHNVTSTPRSDAV